MICCARWTRFCGAPPLEVFAESDEASIYRSIVGIGGSLAIGLSSVVDDLMQAHEAVEYDGADECSSPCVLLRLSSDTQSRSRTAGQR